MTVKDINLNIKYWDNFYKNNFKHTPSQFCVCVLTEIDPTATIVELGSGNGRDAHYFASQGHVTIGMDLSSEAISSCERETKSRKIEHAYFFRGDLTEEDDIKEIINHARLQNNNSKIVFYSRFVMHTLDELQELSFLTILSECMNSGEYVYFEFRSIEDEKLNKHFGGHFRRYVDTSKFKRLLNEVGKLDIHYCVTGNGMAKFKEEDPFVSRIIAVKK